MGGCEHAALDDAARSFRLGKMPSIWPSRPSFCYWAPWAQFFMVEIVYLGSYNVFTCNTLIFTHLGDREWVDGEGCCWMTSSQLGRYELRNRWMVGGGLE